MKPKTTNYKMTTNNIEIETPESSWSSRLVLLIFIIISFIVPIAGTIFASFYLEIGPGIIISYLIFWATGYYFLKLYLWSKYGKEIIKIESEKIVYVADYKLFKGNRKEINSKQFKIEIIKSFDENEKYGTLLITDNNAKIESVINVPVIDLIKIKNKIEKYYA